LLLITLTAVRFGETLGLEIGRRLLKFVKEIIIFKHLTMAIKELVLFIQESGYAMMN